MNCNLVYNTMLFYLLLLKRLTGYIFRLFSIFFCNITRHELYTHNPRHLEGVPYWNLQCSSSTQNLIAQIQCLKSVVSQFAAQNWLNRCFKIHCPDQLFLWKNVLLLPAHVAKPLWPYPFVMQWALKAKNQLLGSWV